MLKLRAENVVIGGGVVGLAVARALALRGRPVVLLDQDKRIGKGGSSRNSEVIHAGLYYPPGSLKAWLCVAGGAALYSYCGERSIPHRRCGKLVVATVPNEEQALAVIAETSRANGVEKIELLSKSELKNLEPQINASSGLLSPATGIVDCHALMLSYQADIEAAGGAVVLQTPVEGGQLGSDGIAIRLGGSDPAALRADRVVNAAGLGAWEVSSKMVGLDQLSIPARYLAKGSYFQLSGKAPFRHLIYPVPEIGGLGVHLTFDLSGQARFGPDVEWTDRIDYAVDSSRAGSFYAAIRRYWPALPENSLAPAYAGIRPKIAPPGAFSDFAIQGPGKTGHPGYAALYGIESPGLTASLAIGELVADFWS